ncbi:CCCH-type zinc finger-containing protein [Tieghemostelium lacteum]|uniref:CCCH-type zinc finger-containing protein n=1 Tax=Tieghemostelium lacteum TaxID=361077 RepID=A0A152A8X6_TIELA|nr:CCCH-type zinc finger-containing protein [Tieghemostelium lacteum]|eukprot:KYR02664.1 CCCH-type zinc finger-containing protein [Tieghemostelium lacteum]
MNNNKQLIIGNQSQQQQQHQQHHSHQNNKRKEEFNETFNQCFSLIETSHQDISVVKVSIQSLVELSTSIYCNISCKVRILNLFLDIIKSPLLYRKTAIRCAIKGIGSLACQDETLITPTITYLAKILEFPCENYQYMKRVCFHSLSRIGRKFPVYQQLLITLFEQYFMNTNSSNDDICSILMAFGRLSQTNSKIRALSMKRWLEAIDNSHYLFKCAGIISIGYASSPSGNIVNDKNIESICYSKAVELLQYHKINDNIEGEEDSWKKQEVYLVQVASCKALGLLARSNPTEWLPRLQKIFKVILSSTRYTGHVKSVVLSIYGQLTYELAVTSPFFTPLKVLLFELSNEDNISISSPSFYSLTKFALSHESNFQEVYEMLKLKLGGGGSGIKNAKPDQLIHFLKTWCKLISRNYRPVLNQCSSIISQFDSYLYEPNSPMSNQLTLAKNRPKLVLTPLQPNKLYANQMYQCENAFNDFQSLNIMCHCFSPLIIQSILALCKKPQLLHHNQYRAALKDKIRSQKELGFNIDQFEQVHLESTYQSILTELSQDFSKREIFISVINNPEIIDSKDFQDMIKSKYDLKKDDQQQSQHPLVTQNQQTPKQSDKPSDPRLKKGGNIFSKPLPLIKDSTPDVDTKPTIATASATAVPTQQPKVNLFAKPLPLLSEITKEENVPENTITPKPQSTNIFSKPLPLLVDQPDTKDNTENIPSKTPLLKEETSESEKETVYPPTANIFSKPLPLLKEDSDAISAETTKMNIFAKPLPLLRDQEINDDISSTSSPKKKNNLALPLMKPAIPIYELPKVIQPIRPSISKTIHSLGMKLMVNTPLPPKPKNVFANPLPLLKDEDGNSDDKKTPDSQKDTDDSLDIQIDIDSYTKELENMLDGKEEGTYTVMEPEEEEQPHQQQLVTSSSPSANSSTNTSDGEESDEDSEQDSDEELVIDEPMNIETNTIPDSYNPSRKRPNSILELEDDPETTESDQKKICLEPNQHDFQTVDLSQVNKSKSKKNHNNTKTNNKNKNNNNNNNNKMNREKNSKKKHNRKLKDNPHGDEGNLYVGIDFTKSKKPEPIQCSFYKLGMCKKGSECTFLHEGPVVEREKEICKFFKTGSCLKDSDCTYSHDLKSEACKYFNSLNGCTNKDCQYGHFISDTVSPIMNNSNPSTPPIVNIVDGQI